MDKKIFAFKLSVKLKSAEKRPAKLWQARPGIAVAGCTEAPGGGGENDLRDRKYGTDLGNYC